MLVVVGLVSCSKTSDNLYSAIANPPLVEARLHTVTLATDSSKVSEELQAKGYVPIQFSSNYPASEPVEASLWSVPEQVAAGAVHFKAPGAGDLNIRVLEMALAASSRAGDAATVKLFFKNVLGTDVP